MSDCDKHLPLRVRFYDVAQALAALVTLPDGRVILVDAGDFAARERCGPSCQTAHDHLVARLKADLAGHAIDLLWITHQHSDHLGGAEDLIKSFPVSNLVDNGLDLGRPQPKGMHAAAADAGTVAAVVDTQHTALPLPDGAGVHLEAVVPPAWPADCPPNSNNCSILLRIEYCASSILFTGDAERLEEDVLPAKPATLLQLGHHGSDTSSTDSFIQRVQPKYAVISAGKPGEGTNRTYCHPRKSVVDRLTAMLGGADGAPIVAFDAAVKCGLDKPENWPSVPASSKLWLTARDGDVVLVTTGDGAFARETPPPPAPAPNPPAPAPAPPPQP